MKDFRNFIVWKKAHELTLNLYRITSAEFPKDERFGLTSQVRRCSASIGANLAEGCGREGNGEFHRFLQIALGSANELEYHLLLARDLGYLGNLPHTSLESQLIEVKKMLVALTAKVGKERFVGKSSVG
jgi:four helix bundle protein